MWEDIFCYSFLLILSLIRYLACYQMIFRIVITKRKSHYVWAVLIDFFIFIIIESATSYDIAFKMTGVISGLLVPLLLCEQSKKNAFMAYPLVLSLNTVLTCFIEYVYAILKGSSFVTFSGIYSLYGSLAAIAFYIIVSYLLRRKENYYISIGTVGIREFLFYLLVLISMFMILKSSIELSSGHEISTVQTLNRLGIGIVFASMMLFSLIVWHGIVVGEKIREEGENAGYQLYLKEQRVLIDEMLRSEEELRRYQHDIKHHLELVEYMAVNSTDDEVKKYCNEILEDSSQYCRTEYTGEIVLDALFHKYEFVAKENDIDLKYVLDIGKNNRVNIFDLCGALSNVLNNAVEACCKTDADRMIDLKVYQTEDRVLISMHNTCIAEPVIKDGYVTTSKGDSTKHGYGSLNIKQTVEKYNGLVEYSYVDGVFYTNIII